MARHTILFLAANPADTDALALGEEARAIHVELERSGYRDCFVLETRWAAQPLDLLRELRKLQPTVVHFSGHGAPQDGLCFQSADGRSQLVAAPALRDTFGAAGSSVKLAVLSACYSDEQADALRTQLDCVVGMTGAIGDAAARNFAIGFYGGLGERASVAAAFRQGCAAISLEGLADHDRPKLATRDGVDASTLVFADDASTRDELLSRLSRLLPSQFETVLFRARIPREHLPGRSSAQASRAVDVVDYAEQKQQLAELARVVGELSTAR